MLISRLAFPPDKKAGSGTDPVLVTLTDEEPKVGCEGSCCSQPSCARLIAKWKENQGRRGVAGRCWAAGLAGAGAVLAQLAALGLGSVPPWPDTHVCADLYSSVQCTCEGALRGEGSRI